MAQCTAPIDGHRTASGAANCPACRGSRSRGYSTSSAYSSPPRRSSTVSHTPSAIRSSNSRQTRSGKSVFYSPAEWQQIEPFTKEAHTQANNHPERRDLFLCHAWDDRLESARELHTNLTQYGASVWFSEDDLQLGSLMLREIDKGLRNCRLGIVLVTPAMLKSIESSGVAEKELAFLLSTRRVIPVLHQVTFEELSDISPLLASHSGLSSKDSSLDDIAAKIAAAAADLPV